MAISVQADEQPETWLTLKTGYLGQNNPVSFTSPGLDAGAAALPGEVAQRRNPGRGEIVPPPFKWVLARVLAEEVRAVNARFDNADTRRWLAYTEERL
jgi:hypothetical protein